VALCLSFSEPKYILLPISTDLSCRWEECYSSPHVHYRPQVHVNPQLEAPSRLQSTWPLPLAGFNAAIAGCFFAVETVLRPASGEAAPTLTISIVMMASVLSSTVARVFLGEAPAFTVPEYEIRSAAGTASALLERRNLSFKVYDCTFERI
jgi:hypothetical protein